jgi:hypothetical protein
MTDRNYNIEVGSNVKDIGMGAVGVGNTLAWGYNIYQIGSLIISFLVLVLFIVLIYTSYKSSTETKTAL